MDWGPMVAQAAQRYGVPPQLAMGVLNAESSGNPQAVSPAGAQGLMQLMPATAAGLGVTDPFNPAQNINGGVQYLGKMLHQFGSPQAALAAYNWGPGNVATQGVAAAPPSTQAYVSKVLAAAGPGGAANATEAAPQQNANVAVSAPWANALADSSAAAPSQSAPSAPWANALDTPQQPQSATAAAPPSQQPQQPNTGVLRNLGLGALKGAADIGATIEQPFDWLNDKLTGTTGTNTARRQALSDFFNENAAPNSLPFQAGDMASLVAGTAGVGGMMAAPIKAFGAAIPAIESMATPLATALESGGFKTGLAPASVLGSAGNLALRTGAGSVVGAASSGLVDPQSTGYGVVLGGVLPGVAQGVGALGRSLYGAVAPVINPASYVGHGMTSMLSPQDAAAVAARIRGAETFVPGSSPTTAQVAGSPLLVQTEKAAGNIPEFKTAQLARDVENNQARWNALMSVAQSPDALQAATAARATQAQPLYDAAHQATANVGPAFMRYAQIPEMQQAMQRANSLASLDAAVGRGTAPVWPTPQSKAINGAALDYTSRSLGDMIGEAQRAGANTKAASLAALKGKVDDWMGAYVPGVQTARSAYAGASVPVNTMEVGQQIANTLGTRPMGAAGIPQMQLGPYRTALTQAMKGAPYGIDPQALATLHGVGQDLQRASISNAVRSPGSDTAYNLAANGWLARNLYGPSFGGASGLGKAVGAVGAAAAGHPMVGLGILGGGNQLGKMVGSRLNARLVEMLMNPQAVLPYLAARSAATQPALGASLMNRIPLSLANTAPNALVSSIYGARQ